MQREKKEEEILNYLNYAHQHRQVLEHRQTTDILENRNGFQNN